MAAEEASDEADEAAEDEDDEEAEAPAQQRKRRVMAAARAHQAAANPGNPAAAVPAHLTLQALRDGGCPPEVLEQGQRVWEKQQLLGELFDAAQQQQQAATEPVAVGFLRSALLLPSHGAAWKEVRANMGEAYTLRWMEKVGGGRVGSGGC